MDIIAEVLSKYTNTKLLFNKSSNKFTKVNTLAKYFGDKSAWYPKLSSHYPSKMKTLKVLSTESTPIIIQRQYWQLVYVK